MTRDDLIQMIQNAISSICRAEIETATGRKMTMRIANDGKYFKYL